MIRRPPSDYERACLAELLADELAASDQPADKRPMAAWTSVARALLNVDEFMTRE